MPWLLPILKSGPVYQFHCVFVFTGIFVGDEVDFADRVDGLFEFFGVGTFCCF
jgi:hypothetical protein